MRSSIPQEHYDAIKKRMNDEFRRYNGKNRHGQTPNQLILHYMKRLGSGRESGKDPYIALAEDLFYQTGCEYERDHILEPNYSKEEITQILLMGLHKIRREHLETEREFTKKVKFWSKPIGISAVFLGLFIDVMLPELDEPIFTFLLPIAVFGYYVHVINKESQRNRDIEDIIQLEYVWKEIARLKDENAKLKRMCDEL